MKRIATCLPLICSVLLMTTPALYAAEQKTVFNTTAIEYKPGTGQERCQARCDRRSGPDVESLRSEGWKIVSSSPRKVVGEAYWYTPCSSCEPHGCTCIGTEYILQRDEPPRPPAPPACMPVAAPMAAPIPAPTAIPTAAMGSEADRLRGENEELKRELEALKRENERLRNQLKTEKKQQSGKARTIQVP